jgi:osmotically-inducible protein OsmY
LRSVTRQTPVDVTVYVQDALDRCALILDDSDVAVDTTGNTVTLSGHVRTWAHPSTKCAPEPSFARRVMSRLP